MSACVTRVDWDISDLWFNRDLSVCAVEDASGDFSHYDDAALREEAETFLGNLSRLGVLVPSVDELLADFFDRI